MSERHGNNFGKRPTRESFAAFCRLLYERHLVTGVGGNVAARSGDGVLVTPSGFSLRDVTSGDVIRVAEGETLRNDLVPSKELDMHLGILKARPEVNVVVHAHGTWIIAASTMAEPGPTSIPAVTPGFAFFAYPLPLVEFHVPGSPELAEAVRKAFSDGELKALLLQNHGLITVGATMAEALNIAEEVDEAAMVHVLAGGKSTTIPEHLIDKLF